MRCRWLALVIGALFLAGPAIVHAQTYPVPPKEFPFDVSRGGSLLEVVVRIVEDRTYEIDLMFNFGDRADADRVSKLVGDGATNRYEGYVTPGIVVPIHLEIFSSAETKNPLRLFKGTLYTAGIYAHGTPYYLRRITEIRLTPGIYQIRAMTFQDTSEFSGTRTQLRIGYYFNSRGFR
jgi:hypothetical protein